MIFVWPCIINVGKVIQKNQLDATIIYWSIRSAQHVSSNLLSIIRRVRLRFLQHMVTCCCGGQGVGERQRALKWTLLRSAALKWTLVRSAALKWTLLRSATLKWTLLRSAALKWTLLRRQPWSELYCVAQPWSDFYCEAQSLSKLYCGSAAKKWTLPQSAAMKWNLHVRNRSCLTVAASDCYTEGRAYKISLCIVSYRIYTISINSSTVGL